ncbi:bifunctional phosphopantothenoylcysteine decarboxylase/phosphopantothenate--cysteine ligase CoaBC [Atopobacter sp. AH10]|uniref:bifunctional phosphopantothenoylcysteine decarboxylase/phosphopantothenate--cysteine ligase CoaBC n=1 Tax=Atopobacter sp. AH10 TaxID=2315861 RepID=UPI000EF23E2D|nr:bifunctional phosphopantothenoylcysteine decarboxylase/phosphopantothenate--cysteine ligase CoaBC [Atopobacter sp. AH10]RLK63733.1 bifunctional phosphopantothenoylcysteine decarboxylase/phosphopantothenate--cysteine ligase CoaBC [Atopobacter sp. AH10]
MLTNRHITVMITGGIAAYKIPLLVRSLIKEGAEVRVLMTQNAKNFVDPFTFEVLTKQVVSIDEFHGKDPVLHIHTADWSDLVIVTPCTANTLGKLANGIADNLVTSCLLACTCPVIIAPAMNHHMLHHPAVEKNIHWLKEQGYWVLPTDYGFLAEGYEGDGRLLDLDLQVLAAKLALHPLAKVLAGSLVGQKWLITAGGTVEAIDPVRYIGNRSSGKMGCAIANMASLLGAEVHLIKTESVTAIPLLPTIKTTSVQSANELQEAVKNNLSANDVLVMAAAVSDYRVETPSQHKLKKQENLTLQLIKNPDILASIANESIFKVAFAAETDHVLTYAREKRKAKAVDILVANDVSKASIGFNSSDNAVTIISENQEKEVPKQAKWSVALSIIQAIIEVRSNERKA